MDGSERRERLHAARLYLVTGSRPGGRSLAEVLEPALRGGVDLVQLREKDAGDAEILAAAAEARPLCTAAGALLLVNDRPDLAVAAGADGVHVGQDDMAVAEARAITGAGAARRALDPRARGDRRGGRATTSASGRCTRRPTKPGRPAVGLDLVRHAAEHADAAVVRDRRDRPRVRAARSSRRARRGSPSSARSPTRPTPRPPRRALRAALPPRGGPWPSVAARRRPEPRTPPPVLDPDATFTERYRGADGVAQRGGRAPSLEPLAPGERPKAVTIAAIVALAMAVLNVAAALSGRTIAGDEGSQTTLTIVTTAILVVIGVRDARRASTGRCWASRSSSGCRSRRCRWRSCSRANVGVAPRCSLVLVVAARHAVLEAHPGHGAHADAVGRPERDPANPCSRFNGRNGRVRLHRHRVRAGRLRRRHPRRPSGTEDRRGGEGRDRRPLPELRLHPREGGAAHGGHPLRGPRRRRVRHQGRRAGGGLRRRDRASPEGRSRP